MRVQLASVSLVVRGRFSRPLLRGLRSRSRQHQARDSTAIRRELSTTVGPVRLTYFNNLSWDGYALRRIAKPELERGFRTSGRTRHSSTRAWVDWPANVGVAQAPSAVWAHWHALVWVRLVDDCRARNAGRLSGGVRLRPCTRRRERQRSADRDARLGLHYHAIRTGTWRTKRQAAVPLLGRNHGQWFVGSVQGRRT